VHGGARARRGVGHPPQQLRLLLARPRAHQEAVGDQHAQLAPGERSHAAQHGLECRERALRGPERRAEHGARLALRLARGRFLLGVQPGRGSAVAAFDRGARAVASQHAAGLVHHEPGRQPQRALVAAEDQLGLGRRELQPPALDVRGLRADAGDRLAQHGPVLRERLQGPRRAGRDEGDPSVRPGLLADEAQERGLRRIGRVLREVQVVGDDREVQRRGLLGAFIRRRGCGRSHPAGAQEPAHALRLAVLEHLHVGRRERRNRSPVRVGHHHVEADDVHLDARDRLLAPGRHRRAEQQRGGHGSLPGQSTLHPLAERQPRRAHRLCWWEC
jgi:hypothetical protein